MITERNKQILDTIILITETTNRPPTLQEVGNIMGMTRERVRQIAKKLKAAGLLENTQDLIVLGGVSKNEAKEKAALAIIRKLTIVGSPPPRLKQVLADPDAEGFDVIGALSRLKEKKVIHNSNWLVETCNPIYTRADYFWSKVDKRGDDECWPWTKSVTVGYGHVRWRADEYFAHRVAYELAYGVRPPKRGEGEEELYVCHKCNNTICCNPKHLYLGTAKQNAEDRSSTGEFTTWAKLTGIQVNDIRTRVANEESVNSITKDYVDTCSHTAVRNAAIGNTYKH